MRPTVALPPPPLLTRQASHAPSSQASSAPPSHGAPAPGLCSAASSYVAILSACASGGHVALAFRYLEEADAEGISFSEAEIAEALGAALRACTSARDFESAEIVLTRMAEMGVKPEKASRPYSAFVAAAARAGRLRRALRAVREMEATRVQVRNEGRKRGGSGGSSYTGF